MKKRVKNIGKLIIFIVATLIMLYSPEENERFKRESSPTQPNTLEEEENSKKDLEKTLDLKVEPNLEPKMYSEKRILTESREEIAEGVKIVEEKIEVVEKVKESSDLDLLARLVHAEARGESYEAKLGVASVVMNRVNSSEFPDTIRGVIYQKRQFSVVSISRGGKKAIEHKAGEDSIKAAREVLENGSVIPSGVVVFYASYCKEPWITSRKIYKRIDGTVFAYMQKG